MSRGRFRNSPCWCASGRKLKHCHVSVEHEPTVREEFGGVRILRPSSGAESTLLRAAAEHLYARFPPGVYDEPEQINEFMKYLFGFYSGRLDRVIPLLGSRGFMDLVLHEYDLTARVEALRKKRRLSPDDERRWSRIGPHVGRALKYLAERITLLAPGDVPSVDEDLGFQMVEVAWICAEQMVVLYNLSDQVFFAPRGNVLTVSPPGPHALWIHRTDQDSMLQFPARVDLHRARSSEVVHMPTYDADPIAHDRILSPAFKGLFGMGYKEALGLLVHVIETAQPVRNGFTALFCKRQAVVDAMCAIGKCSPEVAERILDGFTLSREKMLREGRALFKPKQEYRALRRGFFELPHSTGSHLAWSREMVTQSIFHLSRGVAFGHLPPEWLTPDIKQRLGDVVNSAGAWLEARTAEQLAALGIAGQMNISRGIGQGPARLPLPAEVGELDYLGYMSVNRLLILLECKLLQPGSEARHYRDDATDFLKPKGYVEKFARKVEWVKAHPREVIVALSSVTGIPTDAGVEAVATAFVVLYPSMVDCILSDFPCVSLVDS